MPLLTPEQSCIHVLSSSMYDILTHDYPIEIYISAFPLRHLCIPIRLVKATNNIKTSLIKQCYAWIGANNAADTDTAGVCMLYTTCSMLCAWPIYISLLYHAIKSCNC